MASFSASFHGDQNIVSSLETAIESLARQGRSLAIQSVAAAAAAATTWKADTPIPELVIADPEQGSWLMIAGTPLVAAPTATEDQRRTILGQFLTAPSQWIRDNLDGCFAVLGFDGHRRCVIAATDYNCTVPVFYAVTASGAYVASSELALAQALRAAVDPAGFAQAVHLGAPWGGRSRFEGIAVLGPATVLTVDEDLRINTNPYWHPEHEAAWRGSFDDILDRWGSLVAAAVESYHRRADGVPFLADITAGEDARLVVAQCQALGIPFEGHVGGFQGDADIAVAQEAAAAAGFPLRVSPYTLIDPADLKEQATRIVLDSDGYANFFSDCMRFASGLFQSPPPPGAIRLKGMPGGEAFRGTYYARGKLLFPSWHGHFEPRFFTRMKYLLDFNRDLLAYDDAAFLREVHALVDTSLGPVEGFADGIKVDHLLRLFQTCAWGLADRQPSYLPLATADLTRSIYNLPPGVKKGGALTKALTERLSPELAWIKTQNGVPTVRRSAHRLPMFVPQYLAAVRAVARGVSSRVLKVNQTGTSLKRYLRLDYNRDVFRTLFNDPPYADWFGSAAQMETGFLYKGPALDAILAAACRGECRSLNSLSRIISQELAYRWVRDRRPQPVAQPASAGGMTQTLVRHPTAT